MRRDSGTACSTTYMDASDAQSQGGGNVFTPVTISLFAGVFDFFGILDESGRVVDLWGRIFENTNANPNMLKGQVFPETVFWQSSETTSQILQRAIAAASAGENSKLLLDFRVSAEEKVTMEVSVMCLDHHLPCREIFIGGQAVAERGARAVTGKGASEQLLFAAENAAIGLWFWDFNNDQIHATPRCNELFGLPPYGTFRYEDYREAVHPDDRSFVDAFLTASRDGGSQYKEEFRLVYPDGTIEWIQAEGRSFLDDSGGPLRMLGVIQKITEQKLAAAELAKVHERERKAREEAVEANRAKDFFLAFVSHELRSPLNSIMGWARILLTNDLDETKRRNAFEIIERSAKVQLKLINDLVDSARVASGKLRLEYRPTNLYDIVRNSCEAQKPSADAKNIDLKFQSDSESIALFGDASRLQQVFGNLLSNAIKFTPDGGRVEVRITTGEETVAVEVADSGSGIDQTALPHIFKQFSQGTIEQTRTNVGLGLGLSIVKILVTKHGGTVSAASDGIGKGARFTVTLPLTETAAVVPERIPSAPLPSARPLEGRSIIIVEDDPDSREVLELFLIQNGAVVKSFDSVKAALADFNPAGLPNVIISDLSMPDEDGYSFISKIRSLPPETGGRVPAIALSAFTSEESRQRALQVGFDKYRTKPFEHDLLIRDLLDLLNSGTAQNASNG
jgi:PAS domain S-box-containing protein